MSRASAALLLTLGSWTTALSSSSQQVLIPAAEVVPTLRNATWDDADGIIRVLFDAFSAGPGQSYARPGLHKYRDYMKYCLKEQMRKEWPGDIPSDFSVNVITVPDAIEENTEEIASVAVWRMRSKEDNHTSMWNLGIDAFMSGILDIDIDGPKYDCSLHLGENTTRSADLVRQFQEADKKYIESWYDKQLYLTALATHPTWDGHGFAAMNLKWGYGYAKKEDVPITLIATPAGYPLYDSEGFRSFKNLTFDLLDGLGHLWYEVMDKHVS